MKKLTYRLVLFVSIVLVWSACKDLTDVEAPYRISGDNVVKDQQSAEVVLKGVYSQFRTTQAVSAIEFTSALGLTNNAPALAAYSNEVPIDNSTLQNIYTANYKVIQEANLFMEKVDKLSAGKLGGKTTKENFLAEGQFARALAHFNLLRLFGQHYKKNSEYGIILRKKAADDGKSIPRSTVAKSYKFILNDLDDAISNLTQTSSFRANKAAARALKAKVLLYKQDYDAASSQALTVINNTTRSLESNYQDIFQQGVNSKELLFGPYVDFSNNEKLGGAVGIFLQSNQSVYAQKASSDPRFGLTGFPTQGIQKYTQNFTPFNQATHIHLRLGEVYLIYAEAAARSNNEGTPEYDDAEDKLNEVRNRVGLAAKNPADKPALLEAIRKEKLLELWGENGEGWFDLVRYATIKDDISVINSLKPTVTDQHLYVMPIPLGELSAPEGSEVTQNPGYPRSL